MLAVSCMKRVGRRWGLGSAQFIHIGGGGVRGVREMVSSSKFKGDNSHTHFDLDKLALYH